MEVNARLVLMAVVNVTIHQLVRLAPEDISKPMIENVSHVALDVKLAKKLMSVKLANGDTL